jgi:hypothetical protein
MIQLLTDIEVKKSADKIYSFLLNLDKEKYCLWHSCHKDFKTINKTDDINGSILYFHEVVDGTKANYKWTLIDHKVDKLIKMKANYFYPLYLTINLDGISLNKTIVRHDISTGFQNKFLSLIFDSVVGQTLFSKRVRQSQQRHAIDEYQNLENIL